MKNTTFTLTVFLLTVLFSLGCGKKDQTPPPPESVTDIDGNIYQTVKIGNQVWMAENLKVTRYRNGDDITHVANDTAWCGLSTGAFCVYDNNESNAASYGYLYNFYAVNDSRNIAPEGWHLPTDVEWKELEMYLGMSQADADTFGVRGTGEGSKLKATGTAHWDSLNTNATNESGFSALPGGYRNGRDGCYSHLGKEAYFWTATENAIDHAWYRFLRYNSSEAERWGRNMRYGFSVRLIRD